MEVQKRYSVAEQEMVIGMYEESGKTLRDFCQAEGVQMSRLERWLREKRKRQGKDVEAIRLVEVKAERPRETLSNEGKYRIGNRAGLWVEFESGFEAVEVKELVAILAEVGKC